MQAKAAACVELSAWLRPGFSPALHYVLDGGRPQGGEVGLVEVHRGSGDICTRITDVTVA